MTIEAAAADARIEQSVSWRMTFLLAMSCGLIVANLYYVQPLVGLVSAALGLPRDAAGLVVTMTQLGYSIGLLLIVPLGDLLENRRLVVTVICVAALAMLVTAFARDARVFLTAALFTGLGSVAVQLLMVYAAHLAPEAERGRVVGNVTSGLMLGIMLARPVSSFLTAFSSWHVVFVLSAFVMAVLATVLSRVLPPRQPVARQNYGTFLLSMGHLLLTKPVLRRRAFYQACLFAAFSLFWTVTPLLLSGPEFGMSQIGIGLFALVGVAGAIAAPIAGRIADRGLSLPATGFAMLAVAIAFPMTHIGAPGSPLALASMFAAAVVLDFGVQAHLVFGFRAIFSLGAEFRGRLNGLYMTIFYTAGAVGSALGAFAYAQGGWRLASALGLALPLAALIGFAMEFAASRRAGKAGDQ